MEKMEKPYHLEIILHTDIPFDGIPSIAGKYARHMIIEKAFFQGSVRLLIAS